MCVVDGVGADDGVVVMRGVCGCAVYSVDVAVVVGWLQC